MCAAPDLGPAGTIAPELAPGVEALAPELAPAPGLAVPELAPGPGFIGMLGPEAQAPGPLDTRAFSPQELAPQALSPEQQLQAPDSAFAPEQQLQAPDFAVAPEQQLQAPDFAFAPEQQLVPAPGPSAAGGLLLHGVCQPMVSVTACCGMLPLLDCDPADAVWKTCWQLVVHFRFW